MSQKTRKYGITNELAKFSKATGRPAKRREIAKVCGVSSVTVSNWENIEHGDAQQIGVDDLQKIATILGCELTELVNEQGFKSA